MKFFKLLSLMAFVSASLFMASCSDDDNDNPVTPTNSNYFVMTNGSSWISDFYKKNMGNQTVTSTLVIDTTKALGTEAFLGKTATKLGISSNDGSSKSYHQYFENNTLYSELNFIMPSNLSFLPDNVIPANQWIPLVKTDSSSWNVFSQALPVIPYKLNDALTANITSVLSVIGTRGTAGTMQIDGKSINTQVYEYTFSIVGTAAVSGIALPIPVSINLVMRLTYGENAGLVKQEMDSQTASVTLPIGGNQKIQDIEGFVNTCRSYTIR